MIEAMLLLLAQECAVQHLTHVAIDIRTWQLTCTQLSMVPGLQASIRSKLYLVKILRYTSLRPITQWHAISNNSISSEANAK